MNARFGETQMKRTIRRLKKQAKRNYKKAALLAVLPGAALALPVSADPLPRRQRVCH